MRNIAVIPARSGSKGVKDKNIRQLCGKPLLAYSVETALKANIFDRVHVSTDSERYQEIAQKYGADVPFLRKPDMASDTASTWDAMRFVLDEYKKRGEEFDILTVLQPTSPLRTSEDISAAYSYFQKKEANMISSVCEMEHSPLWSNTLPDDLSMENFEDESIVLCPRQALPTFYRENGAIYMIKVDYLFSCNNIYKNKCYAFIMQAEHSVDIDTELDFRIAETILNIY